MGSSLDALVAELQPFARALVDAAGAAGLLPRVTSTLRTASQQARLYRRYLEGQSAYPAAAPGTSAHEFGEAFDLLVSPYEALADVGTFWQSMGGTWGGQRDPVHFELPGASLRHRASSPRPWTHTLAMAVDILIGLNPYIGAVELAATLVGLGYPENEVLQFLSGPAEYVFK